MTFTTDDRIWAIPLDRYERDNLVSLLEAVALTEGSPNAMGAANTGDWVMQVLSKLRRRDNVMHIDENDHPNRLPSDIRKDAIRMANWVNK